MIRIDEFEPLADASGFLYRPRVYGDPHEARWDGYIVFFPIGPGAVVSTPRETTQRTLESLEDWARSLDAVYLEGALARALAATPGIMMPATVTEYDLAAAETYAAGDAIALHHVAERAALEAASELAAAEMHDEAAATARENAKRLARKHDELEDLAGKTTKAAAEAAADLHEAAAREARAVAADAAAAQRAQPKKRSPRKKRR